MDTIDVPLAYFVGFEITEQNRIDMLYKRNWLKLTSTLYQNDIFR